MKSEGSRGIHDFIAKLKEQTSLKPWYLFQYASRDHHTSTPSLTCYKIPSIKLFLFFLSLFTLLNEIAMSYKLYIHLYMNAYIL